MRIEEGGTQWSAEGEAVRALLGAANAEAGFPDAPQELVLSLKDEAGTLTGGLIGRLNWGWLWVLNLAVRPGARGAGWGARLLADAEAWARARGAIGLRLDTYSFQARGFYEKAGFTLVGEIADCPPGQTRFSMAKRIDGAAPAATPWPDAAAPRATVAVTETEFEPAAGAILDGLVRHNAALAEPHGWKPLNLAVRRPGETRPAGGIIGYVLYRWLFIRMFYLPEDLRRGGLGAALIARAEAEARARGCVGIWLDTFSWQARPFYEKQGFRVFGAIEDFPPGASRYFLMKRLDGAGGES
jgi:GNAT superfamily N-acetyltransferase